MKIEISTLDISMMVSKHLSKHNNMILTEKTIWHLVMDIQHDFDVMLIEIENRQHTYEQHKKIK